MKNTESKTIQRAGASPHPLLDTLSRARELPTRHSARLTRARGPPTRRTTPRSRLVPRIAAKVARRGALSPGNQTKPLDHRRSSNHHIAFPLHQVAATKSEERRSRPRRLPTMYRTEGAQPCCQPRRDPLQAKSAPVAVATSIVLQRCPAPRWRLPSNTRRREMLQAAEQ
jgi:hypothetical protein